MQSYDGQNQHGVGTEQELNIPQHHSQSVQEIHSKHETLPPLMQQSQILIPISGPAEPIISQTSAIYFCFVDDKYDKLEVPNKLVLARGVPTVADLTSTLKTLFFPGQNVTLTVSFMQGGNEFTEHSLVPVPVNDRTNMVLIRPHWEQGLSKFDTQTMQVLHWLQVNNLDTPEVISIFQQHKITIDNMKYLRDSDFMNFGIKDWGTRISILDAISKYFSLLPSILMDVQGFMRQNIIEQVGQQITESHKRKFEPEHIEPEFIPIKRQKTPTNKKRIRFKDLDVLVNDPLIPVDIGSSVLCEGSNIRGVVVLNKQKKPVVEYMHKSKKKCVTIAQYYKAATKESLQAKGDSWRKIFFSDIHTNVNRSLEELKYLIKGPKKAVSAFLYFSKEIRETLPKTADFAKRSGDMWKALREEQKQKYKLKEGEDKERFNREKAHWIALITQLQQQRGITDVDIKYEY